MSTGFADMDLEAKVGQLMMVGFDGCTLTGETAFYLRARKFGSVVLFARNLKEPVQIRSLTSQLQEFGDEDTGGLIIAVDQEGGAVVRLTHGATVFPGNMALGATGDPNYAYRAARVMGAEMKALGLNLNLAPVLDVNNNPHNPGIGIRSYGESAHLVARMGVAAIRGYHDAGVAVTAKHFPGKGDCTVDSHLDMPIIPHSRDRLDEVELLPFKRAIAEGVDVIMTAHVNFPAYDESGTPATLSHAVLTGLLREKLGYSGVIITDDLLMGGITRRYPVGEAAVRAFEAGADLLVVAHPGENQEEVWRALLEAARSGRISPRRLDESIARIQGLKKRLGLMPGSSTSTTLQVRVEQGSNVVGAPESRELALEIARHAITVIRNDGDILPLKISATAKIAVVSPEIKALTMVEDDESAHNPLAKEVAARGANVVDIEVGESPTEDEIDRAIARASTCDVIIVATYNAHLHLAQAGMVRRLIELGRPVVACALRNPYDVATIPEAKVFVASYGFRDCNLKALVEVIFGGQVPTGRLPVSIPGVCPAGFGISWGRR